MHRVTNLRISKGYPGIKFPLHLKSKSPPKMEITT